MSEAGRTARDVLLGLLKTCRSSASRSISTSVTAYASQAPCPSRRYRTVSGKPPPLPDKPPIAENLPRLPEPTTAGD
jgi:hypothetical protein